MIAIVASEARERAAFAALCEARGWAHAEFDSVRAFRRVLAKAPPQLVLCRHRLADGYSDDILQAVLEAAPVEPKIVVLMHAGAIAGDEARQLVLGADYVFRDPVRTEVLVECLRRQLAQATTRPAKRPRRAAARLQFGAATIEIATRTIRHDGRVQALTPRELQLVELLVQARGEVVSYGELYHDILGRAFRGDTSNMRVLLGKLDGSFRAVGINLRHHVEVIAKSGYRYHARRRVIRLQLKQTPPADAAA